VRFTFNLSRQNCKSYFKCPLGNNYTGNNKKSKVLKYLERLNESDETQLTNNKERELQEKTEIIHDLVGANPEQGRTETETEEFIGRTNCSMS
jgi:hypothetical protein